jgi:hypothetical protein
MNEYDPGNGPLVVMSDAPKRPSGCRIVFTLLVVIGAAWCFGQRGNLVFFLARTAGAGGAG